MKIPDKRTVSCWIAINDAVKENEFMWFIPRRKFKNDLHHASILGGAQSFETSKENAVFIPVVSGVITFHAGFTPHFSKWNTIKS